MENGSGGFFSDITFTNGFIGMSPVFLMIYNNFLTK